MSFVEIFATGSVQAGIALLFMAGVLEWPLARRSGLRRETIKRTTPAHGRLIVPLWRALALAAFVLLAYPFSYGIRQGPGFAALAGDGAITATARINAVFMASLLLPLVPWLRRHGAAVLALQGGLAITMVFGWYAAYIRAASVDYWPGLAPALAVAVTAMLGYRGARRAGRALGAFIDRRVGTSMVAPILAQASAQAMLAPAALLYAYSLGLQLSI